MTHHPPSSLGQALGRHPDLLRSSRPTAHQLLHISVATALFYHHILSCLIFALVLALTLHESPLFSSPTSLILKKKKKGLIIPILNPSISVALPSRIFMKWSQPLLQPCLNIPVCKAPATQRDKGHPAHAGLLWSPRLCSLCHPCLGCWGLFWLV